MRSINILAGIFSAIWGFFALMGLAMTLDGNAPRQTGFPIVGADFYYAAIPSLMVLLLLAALFLFNRPCKSSFALMAVLWLAGLCLPAYLLYYPGRL